jgi:hypothetical protein
MKIPCMLFILMLLNGYAYAQTGRRLLIIIQPPCDSLLFELKDNMSQRVHNVSFNMYEPSGQCREEIDVTDELSKGKEAYEFLRFEESLDILNKIIARLSVHLNSNESLDMLKEAYLYSAMDYLALDKITDAWNAVDAYLCVSGTPLLDANLWPPNLVNLIKSRSNKNRISGTHGSFMSVTVTTNPSESEVFIDGDNSGISPLHIDLLQCTHYVRVSKRTYLTKGIPIIISKDTRVINIELAPDTLAMSDSPLSAEQIKYLIDRHKVDGILMLSSTVTQAAIRKDIRINAKIIDARSLTPSSVTFAYKNKDQASEELVRFIQTEQDINIQSDAMSKIMDQENTDKNRRTSISWYKNKWLWAAGATIVAGGIIYAATQGNAHQSSTTGSISIKW